MVPFSIPESNCWSLIIDIHGSSNSGILIYSNSDITGSSNSDITGSSNLWVIIKGTQ